jgi:hypothetical protein
VKFIKAAEKIYRDADSAFGQAVKSAEFDAKRQKTSPAK